MCTAFGAKRRSASADSNMPRRRNGPPRCSPGTPPGSAPRMAGKSDDVININDVFDGLDSMRFKSTNADGNITVYGLGENGGPG
jgi:hypothetical protein